MRLVTSIVSVTAVFAAVHPSTMAQESESPSKGGLEFKPQTMLNRALPVVADAPFIPAKQVTNEVVDNELVLGVVIAGQARAYPINMLNGPWREVVNDKLGGHAIAATW